MSAHNLLAVVLGDMGRSEDALARLQRAVAIDPTKPQAHCDVADMLHEHGRPDDAIRHYRRALALDPAHSAACMGLGMVLAAIGRQDEASILLKKAIDLEPTNTLAYFHLGQAVRFTSDDHYLGGMQRLAQNAASLSLESQCHLHFALGKAYADVGDYDRSFHHLQQGNSARRQHTPYMEAKSLGLLERVRAVFTPTLIREKAGFGDPSVRPVFIVGMHRSGSTLVEQVLASHPCCFGAGELADISLAATELHGPNGAEFPESVPPCSEQQLRTLADRYLSVIGRRSTTAERVTDKMPGNFVYAGLIHILFPNARIIHTRRDPRDTAISCYSTLLGQGIGHSTDLADLGRFYRHYRLLMAHWSSVLPDGVMLDVDYEALVEDFGTQARRIVAHCGLEWDDTCNAFYRNARSVRTASVGQVHQPIYRSSIGRWRRYEKFMVPFLDALDGPNGRADQSNDIS